MITLTKAAALSGSAVATTQTFTAMAPSVTFTRSGASDNWYTEVDVSLAVDPDFVPVEGTEFDRVFPLEPHTTNAIGGAVVINGGAGDKDRALKPAVMLPYESPTAAKDSPLIVDESEQTDTLLVFNDSSSADDTGRLSATNISGLGMGAASAFAPTETVVKGSLDFASTGTGGSSGSIMGAAGSWDGFAAGDIVFVEGSGSANGDQYYRITGITSVAGGGDSLLVTALPGSAFRDDPAASVSVTRMREVPAGINYAELEIVEVMLGTGNDHFTVEGTAVGAITVVHGGGNALLADGITMGGDTITVTGGGGAAAPLIIYGDTSQDGWRYDSVSGFATGRAIAFDHAGNDLIDASASTAGVTIYGGAGKDTIYGSQGDDQLAGGSGDDEIHGDDNPTDTIDGTSAVGRDHIYGDGGINADLTTRLDLATQVITLVTVPAPATDGASSDGLAPGGDTLFGDGGDDIILGDHGVITQAPGTMRLLTTGMVHRIETTENASGGIDRIQGGAGNDQILGGHMGDFIDGNDGDNIILGDHGAIDYVIADGDRLRHRPDHQPVDRPVRRQRRHRQRQRRRHHHRRPRRRHRRRAGRQQHRHRRQRHHHRRQRGCDELQRPAADAGPDRDHRVRRRWNRHHQHGPP